MEKNPQNDLVYPGERVDDLQNGLYVIQNPEKFCFGMDAVLLSGFADIRQNEKVLDMGTGTGIIPFLLKAKDKGSHLTGLEIQEECADMARRSVSYNHLEADIASLHQEQFTQPSLRMDAVPLISGALI